MANTYNNRIQKFTNDGAFFEEWLAPGVASSGYGLDVVNMGTVILNQYVFVTDFSSAIQIFKWKSEVGGPDGAGNPQ